MSIQYPIIVAGKTFLPEEQDQNNQQWVDALAQAHLADVTYCACNQHSPIPLVVKRYGANSLIVRYGLARWPDTGIDHDLECGFFSEDDETTSQSLPAFHEEDGNLRVHLDTPLTRTAEKGKLGEFARSLKVAPKRKPDGDETRIRERASLNMLLLRLWRQSRLNIYHGKPRTWYQATFAIIHAAKKIIINRGGESLADYLYVLSIPSDKLAKSHNAAVMAHVSAAHSRMFMIGRMHGYKTDKDKTFLPMSDRNAMPKTLVSAELLAASYGDSNFVQNVLSDGAGNLIGLATIEPAGTEWWTTVSLTTLSTSQNLLPAFSSAELELENYLSGMQRSFLRPIHTGEQTTNKVAEYVLLDTPVRYRVEVWGSNDECLLSHLKLLSSSDPDVIVLRLRWSANPRKPFPDLPDAR